MKRNWKTTLAGIIVAIATFGGAMGLPPRVIQLATGIAIAAGFSVAKDYDMTGGANGGNS